VNNRKKMSLQLWLHNEDCTIPVLTKHNWEIW